MKEPLTLNFLYTIHFQQQFQHKIKINKLLIILKLLLRIQKFLHSIQHFPIIASKLIFNYLFSNINSYISDRIRRTKVIIQLGAF